MRLINHYLFFLSLMILTPGGFCQVINSDTPGIKIIVAGKEYKKSAFHQWLWGRNRRVEWTTPIRLPVLWLDSVYGGLKPYKVGGGNETKTLQLKTSEDKEYTLRSINKSRKDVIQPAYKNTFIEEIIKDGISMSHPYGAFALPVMEEQAGIHHANPKLVFVPYQDALDTFNNKFGNDLYLLEQRPQGDWSDANNFGNFKYFISTENLVEQLLKDNRTAADQFAFVKARLFDMLIGDWDRHEDNWQWGSSDTTAAVYHPIPRDRDQAFYTHNGVLIDKMLAATGLSFMQNFDKDLKGIETLNFEERNMDRFFTNAMTVIDWTNAARQLQQALTDRVIEQSVRELPPEIFKVSGKELISKLKLRLAQLEKAARQYYLFLAKEVEITGSKQREYFYVKGFIDGKVLVQVFRIDEAGIKTDSAHYSRIFQPTETKEIRLYGLDGEDIYTVEGKLSIHLRIIGGRSKDSVMGLRNEGKIDIYDDPGNNIQINARLHLKTDSAIHAFRYASFNYNSAGFTPAIFYNNDDRFFIGIGYSATKHAWRRIPYATKQTAAIHYSLSQKALSASYGVLFPNLFNGWNTSFSGNYDAVKWTNFFGPGNETALTTSDKNYFRMRTREWQVNAGIGKKFRRSNVSISAFYQSVRILNDTDRYVIKTFLPLNMDALETNNYVSVQSRYSYVKVDDSIIPVRGINYSVGARYVFNVLRNEFFQDYSCILQVFIPVFNKFSLAVKAGGSKIVGSDALTNSAEFYEHAVIGGPGNLRGFNRERFWGKTSFYNNNEFRYVTDVRTKLFNAKAGVFAFFDDGRVWVPEEISNVIHTAYGAGILLAPFYKIYGTISYGISKEARLLQIRINKLF